MASFAENFRAGADVIGAGMDRSLRAQQLRLQEAQQRLAERKLQQEASLVMEQAAKYKADRVQQEMDNDLKKAAGENFPIFLAEELATGKTPEQAQEAAFKRTTMPLALANPKLYIEMHDAKRTVFDPTITRLKDSGGQPVDVLRTGPNQFRQVRTPANATGSSATPAMKDLEAANAKLAQANQLEAAGDAAGAKALRDDALLLKQSHTKSGGMRLEVTPDGSVTFSEGGQAGDVPMGIRTRVGERLAQTQKAITDMDSMVQTLKPEHVGVKGVLGEFLFDRVAPQFGLNTADSARISSRTKIGMLRETLMRQVSADTRFSNMDAVRITKFLPSSGIFESMEHATGAVDTAKRIMGKRALIDAQEAKQPPPYFAIVALPDDALMEAVQAQLLTWDQAATEFNRRHPELQQAPP